MRGVPETPLPSLLLLLLRKRGVPQPGSVSPCWRRQVCWVETCGRPNAHRCLPPQSTWAGFSQLHEPPFTVAACPHRCERFVVDAPHFSDRQSSVCRRPGKPSVFTCSLGPCGCSRHGATRGFDVGVTIKPLLLRFSPVAPLTTCVLRTSSVWNYRNLATVAPRSTKPREDGGAPRVYVVLGNSGKMRSPVGREKRCGKFIWLRHFALI